MSLALADRINTMNQSLATQATVLEENALALRNNALELEKKNTELEKCDKLKDEFLANTSHELRAPLNGIIGLSDALLQGVAGALPAQAVHNMELIKSSGQRLYGLVIDILGIFHYTVYTFCYSTGKARWAMPTLPRAIQEFL